MPVTYVKMIDLDGVVQSVEQDRQERFLAIGWTIQSSGNKKSQVKSSKNKISAKAQVTSDEEVVEETKEECPNCGGEHPYEDCSEDNWTYSEDDFETAKKED